MVLKDLAGLIKCMVTQCVQLRPAYLTFLPAPSAEPPALTRAYAEAKRTDFLRLSRDEAMSWTYPLLDDRVDVIDVGDDLLDVGLDRVLLVVDGLFLLVHAGRDGKARK